MVEVPQASQWPRIKRRAGYILCPPLQSSIGFCKPQVRTQNKQTWVSTRQIMNGTITPRPTYIRTRSPEATDLSCQNLVRGSSRFRSPFQCYPRKYVCLLQIFFLLITKHDPFSLWSRLGALTSHTIYIHSFNSGLWKGSGIHLPVRSPVTLPGSCQQMLKSIDLLKANCQCIYPFTYITLWHFAIYREMCCFSF